MSGDARLVNLDVALAAHIAPKIRAFARANTDSYPGGFDTLDEWLAILDRIAWAFEYATTDAYYNPTPDEIARFDEGMHAFSKWFRSLWI